MVSVRGWRVGGDWGGREFGEHEGGGKMLEGGEGCRRVGRDMER